MRPLPKSLPILATPHKRPGVSLLAWLAAGAWLFAPAPGMAAGASGKASKLPVTIIEKSLPGTTPRQDRLDLNEPDDQAPGGEPDVAAPQEPDQIDPLDLLVPSDPHVEQAPAAAGQKPQEQPRQKKKPRKTSGTSRAISISKVKGKLKLNRFHTLKLDMDHNSCRKFPSVFLKDYELPRGAVETLADNMVIVQKRICASNGSIMVTCYQNEATLSMRRRRPDDGCGK